MIFKAEGIVNTVYQTNNIFDFIFDLLTSHKDMGIILCEAANTHKAVKCAGKLMPVNKAKFAHTKRQILI